MVAAAHDKAVPAPLGDEFAAGAQAFAAVVAQPPLPRPAHFPGERRRIGWRCAVGRQQGEQALVPARFELGQKQRQIGAPGIFLPRRMYPRAVDDIGCVTRKQKVVEMGVGLDQVRAMQRAQQCERRGDIDFGVRRGSIADVLRQALRSGQQLGGQQPGAGELMQPAQRRCRDAGGVQPLQAGVLARVVPGVEEQFHQYAVITPRGAEHQSPSGQVAVDCFPDQEFPVPEGEAERPECAARCRTQRVDGGVHRCHRCAHPLLRAMRRASAARSRRRPRRAL